MNLDIKCELIITDYLWYYRSYLFKNKMFKKKKQTRLNTSRQIWINNQAN